MTKKLRILVTGGAGFIASNIVDAYIEAGHHVVVIDNLSSGKRSNLNPKAKFYKIDVRDPNISRIFAKEKPQIINHHAAQIDVRRSVEDPIFDAKINILGTLNILKNALKYKAKKIIFASTGGALYGEAKYFPADENHPLDPISPYAISKHSAETYINSLCKTNKLPFTVLRYGNVYGPRQDPHGEAGVISIFIGALLQGKTPVLYGFGKPLRDYVYVKDVVSANMIALKKGNFGTYNIGTEKGVSVKQVFDNLLKIIKVKVKPTLKPLRKGEIHKIYLSSAKAKKALGWKAQFDIKKGLRETVQYFNKTSSPRRACRQAGKWGSVI